MGLEYGIQCSCGLGEQGLYTGLGAGQCGYECYGDGGENCGKPSTDPHEPAGGSIETMVVSRLNNEWHHRSHLTT